ncbi:MAG: efflux RND transporter permease subunit [Candidatus Eremiobacteraeota bacterium]|nr:efflux RND transporter permease subunit [Candidatus Eremiobacteraeota bacterium]
MWLTRFAVRQPTIVTLFFLAIGLFGAIGYASMGKNIIPNVNFPVVTVQANYPGASPEEIERLIIRPIEDQIQTIRHLEKVNATAVDGSASIAVQFKLGTNVDSAANDVTQAVNAARATLPSDLDPPVIDKVDVTAQPILIEAITAKGVKPTQLSNIVVNEIEPDLKGVKGVGNVQIAGDYPRQFYVEPDPGKLFAMRLTMLDVNSAVANGNVSMPGGRLDQPTQESTIGVRADITDASQLARLTLTSPGITTSQVHVGDVAQVLDGYEDHRLISTVDNRDSIIAFVSRDSDSDTVRTTKAVRAEFKDLAKRYPALHFSEVGADNEFTMQSINGVLQNLGEGIVLTAIVLLLFLHVWRSALVVMVAIPSSLLATFFVSWMLGFTIDVLSLMGLSLTIGILVDDSIVVIENITRHREMGKGAEEAAIVGRSEIGGAAVAITLVDVVVFAPIAFMSGIIGQYMKEFGLVVVCATLFSLLVSFTLTPLLAARWALARKPRPLTRAKLQPRRTFFGWLLQLIRVPLRNAYVVTVNTFQRHFEWIKVGYHDYTLPRALRHPYLVFFGSFAMVAFAIGLLIVPMLPGVNLPTIIPGEFQPYTEWGEAVVTVQYPAGTPITVTAVAAERITKALQKMKGVRTVSATVGRGSNGFSDVIGGQMAEIRAELYDNQRHQEHNVVAAAEKLGYLAPGAHISAAGAQNAGAPPITYTVTGPAAQRDAFAAKLGAFIAKNPSAQDVETSNSVAGPRLEIRINRDMASQLGVSPQDVASTARAAVGGLISTKVRMPEGLVYTILRLPQPYRSDLATIQNLQVRAADGSLVPLTSVASFVWTSEPPIIERQNRQRIVRVYANAANGAPIGLVTEKVNEQLAKPGFVPAGVTATTSSDSDAGLFGDAVTKLGLALLTSLLLIYMLLVVLYRAYLAPLVIMFSVPVALVGAFGILAVLNVLHGLFPGVRTFQGQSLNLFSMLGLVMLVGLVAKNGILLVDYANTLRGRGMALLDAIRESATIRFRPIVMTTVAMIAGMMPLALGITEGAEFRKSMGTVIIGGLTSSLFLTLFLVPVVYVWIMSRVDRAAQKRLQKRLRLARLEGEISDDGRALPAPEQPQPIPT